MIYDDPNGSPFLTAVQRLREQRQRKQRQTRQAKQRLRVLLRKKRDF